jgi:preprotein translocase subunit YajC
VLLSLWQHTAQNTPGAVVAVFLQPRAALFLQQSPTNSIALFAPYVLIGVVFYFLLFMPMQRQKKRQQQMLNELKSGDNVVTSGGIVGTITAVESDTIVLRVKPDNLKLQFARSSVSTLVPPEGSKK